MSGTGHKHEAHGPGHALERLIFFSDAVFAIAITLLVIELHVPQVHGSGADIDYWRALAPMIPNFVGFFISFFVIGQFWMGHHRTFDCARHWDPRLMLPNLMMLCAIAAMPFFTALSSEHFSQRVPTMLYCGWMTVIALLNLRVQRIATAPPVVGEHVTLAHRAVIRSRGVAVALGTGTSLVVSVFAPFWAYFTLGTIPLWQMLLKRLVQPRG